MGTPFERPTLRGKFRARQYLGNVSKTGIAAISVNTVRFKVPRMGIEVHRDGEGLRYAYRVAILAAVRPAV